MLKVTNKNTEYASKWNLNNIFLVKSHNVQVIFKIQLF